MENSRNEYFRMFLVLFILLIMHDSILKSDGGSMFLNFVNLTIILYMQHLFTFLLNLFLRKITSLPDYNKKKYILIITLQLRVVFYHFDIKKVVAIHV